MDMQFEASLKKAIAEEIERRVRGQVEAEIRKIKDNLDAQVSEIVGSVAVKLANFIEYKRMGETLVIRVRVEGRKADG